MPAQTMKMTVLRLLSLGMGNGKAHGWAGGYAPAQAVVEVLIRREAYQRAFYIVKQTRPRAAGRARARDEHIVAPLTGVKWRKRPNGLPQPAFGAISHHRAADLAGRREA